MNRLETVFSLFGRDLHHRHITAEQDVRNELFVLLASASETYLRDVIDSGKFSLQEHSHWRIAWK